MMRPASVNSVCVASSLSIISTLFMRLARWNGAGRFARFSVVFSPAGRYSDEFAAIYAHGVFIDRTVQSKSLISRSNTTVMLLPASPMASAGTEKVSVSPVAPSLVSLWEYSGMFVPQ